jgi:hypothetical protein
MQAYVIPQDPEQLFWEIRKYISVNRQLWIYREYAARSPFERRRKNAIHLCKQLFMQ